LDLILQNCHRELDSVLGILARTSAASVLVYATLLRE